MANDENKNEKEVVKIELDEWNAEIEKRRKAEEQIEKLMAYVDAMEKQKKAAPTFGVPQNNMGLSVPYMPKESKLEAVAKTVGKGVVSGIVAAGLVGLGAWLFGDRGSTGTDVF